MTKALLEKIKEMEEKLGKGWMQQLEGINTKEELVKKASALGIELREEQATEAMAFLTNDTDEELSEAELSAVAGGYFYC
jgi:hypothetical protein